MASLTPSGSDPYRRVRAADGVPFEDEQALADMIAPQAPKFFWFRERGYEPHLFQVAFHFNRGLEGNLRRYRNLVAGRRGGKTLSAAWEIAYYCANPTAFHLDAHGKEDDTPLHVWILTPDYRSSGRAALHAMRKVLRESGLREGVDYKENRGELFIEFTNGSLIEFKTAERPDKLVGAGLDILWIDEAALVGTLDAWNIARPALSDKLGIVICTTTPRGKNWYYELFWVDLKASPDVSSVEYRSIDNPHFSSKEWRELKRDYHPLMFKQEFMASFDSMAGKELRGDWLHYYTLDPDMVDSELIGVPRSDQDPQVFNLDTYVGVDPAVSLADEADNFAIAAIGVTKDRRQAYVLDVWRGKIPFPEQLEKIGEWHNRWTPDYIGVESQAYQRVLAEQAMRLEGMPNVIAIFAQGKKFERILSMAPLFKTGRVRIRKAFQDFIDEWLDYDSTKKNTKDDTLDAVEIALRTAGILLPASPSASAFEEMAPKDFSEWAWRHGPLRTGSETSYDPEMGEDV